MAIQLGSAYAKVEMDASGVQRGVTTAISSLENLATSAKKIGQTMQGIGTAMTIGLTVPIVAFFKASVTSAMEAEDALTELKAVLESTGGIAGVTADEITTMASELQKVTKFSDDTIISGQSMLLTFTNIGKEVFPQATEAMLNMAEKFGSIDEASVQLGKALNDPIQGVTALRRVGVMLSDEQENQIKAFMAVNDIASAQKVILKELETEFGGLAKAAGETTAGKFTQLANAFDDLKEVVGEALIPMILKLAEGLTKLVEGFMALPDWAQKGIIIFLGLVALAGPMLVFVGTIITTVAAIPGFVAALGALGPAFAAISTVIIGTVIPAIVAFIVAAAPVIITVLAIAGLLYLLYLAFKNNFLGIRTNAENLWASMKTGFKSMSDNMADSTHTAWENIKAGINETTENLKTKTSEIATAFQEIGEAIRNPRWGFELLYEDGSGALLKLATAFGAPEQAAQDLLSAIWLLISPNSGMPKLYEDGSGALLELAMAFGIPEQAAQDFLAKLWLAINSFRDGIGTIKSYFSNMAVSIRATAEQLSSNLKNIFTTIAAILKDNFNDGMALARLYVAEGVAWIELKWAAFVDWLGQWAARARDWIIAAFNINWSQVGQNIVNGIIDGLMSMWDALVQAATDMANAVMDTFDSILDMGSPSREMQKRGMNSALGYIQGMRRGMNPAEFAQLAAIPLQAATVGGMRGGEFTQVNHFASGLTERHVARMIGDSREDLIDRLTRGLENWNG